MDSCVRVSVAGSDFTPESSTGPRLDSCDNALDSCDKSDYKSKGTGLSTGLL